MNRKTPNYFSPIPLSSFYTTSEIHSSHTKKDIKSEKAKKCLFCYLFPFFSPIGLGVWTVTLEGKSGANQQRFFSFSLSVVLPPTLPPCLGELGIIGLLLSHL